MTGRFYWPALDRRELQVSGQGASEQWASSGWAAGEQARSPAAGVEEEITPPATPFNPSGYTNHNVDTPLSGACHVLWGPTGTPWGRAEGCNM